MTAVLPVPLTRLPIGEERHDPIDAGLWPPVAAIAARRDARA